MVAELHITEAPADIPAAIRAAKAELRTRTGDYQKAFAEVGAAMRREVAEIVALREHGEEVWPVVQFADVAAGTVPPETVAAIRRRGCAIVRGTFPRERAVAWDAELVSYLDDNDFMGRYRYLDNGEFSGLAAGKPSIYPIYWSGPQMQAREDANMVAVRCFLNSFWAHESEGRTWFDPSRAVLPEERRLCQGCGQAFLAGQTPDDFAPEHYEVDWAGRPGPADLSPVGRRQLGLQAWCHRPEAAAGSRTEGSGR